MRYGWLLGSDSKAFACSVGFDPWILWGAWGGAVTSAATILTHPTPAYHMSRNRGVWELGYQPPALSWTAVLLNLFLQRCPDTDVWGEREATRQEGKEQE